MARNCEQHWRSNVHYESNTARPCSDPRWPAIQEASYPKVADAYSPLTMMHSLPTYSVGLSYQDGMSLSSSMQIKTPSPTPLYSRPVSMQRTPRNKEIAIGRWTAEEHRWFLRGLEMFRGPQWGEIARVIGTRTSTQVRTHAQKFFTKLARANRTLPYFEEQINKERHRLSMLGSLTPTPDRQSPSTSFSAFMPTTNRFPSNKHKLSPSRKPFTNYMNPTDSSEFEEQREFVYRTQTPETYSRNAVLNMSSEEMPCPRPKAHSSLVSRKPNLYVDTTVDASDRSDNMLPTISESTRWAGSNTLTPHKDPFSNISRFVLGDTPHAAGSSQSTDMGLSLPPLTPTWKPWTVVETPETSAPVDGTSRWTSSSLSPIRSVCTPTAMGDREHQGELELPSVNQLLYRDVEQ